MINADATLELWRRLSRPFDAASAVEALTGLHITNVRQIVGMRLATSREADVLLDKMHEIVRSLAIATTDSPVRCEGEVRGPILWSETMAARASSPGAGGVFVCASPVKAYDTDENRVLRHALTRIRDSARDADPTGHSHGDDDTIRRARFNGTRAIRALEHRTLAAVSKSRPSGRAVQKARSGTRARVYKPAVALLERALEPIDGATVAEHCDDHTRRQHGLLLALADRLELGPFRVTGQWLENKGLRYIHKQRAGDDGMYGVLLRNLLLDVPDPANGIDRFQAERNLTARAHNHPVLIVTGPEDVARAIRLTDRR
ncbi:MAG TPA: hypothetical protein VGZ03_08395 [Acidimicrobiales bacterium]|nr:hypothetical protein [Acidimicrobiales bacterium]